MHMRGFNKSLPLRNLQASEGKRAGQARAGLPAPATVHAGPDSDAVLDRR